MDRLERKAKADPADAQGLTDKAAEMRRLAQRADEI